MGCDIHPYIEYERRGDVRHFARLSAWRNYDLFAVLAGVRNSQGVEPIAPARGLPERNSWQLEHDYYLVMDDQRAKAYPGLEPFVDAETATEYLRQGAQRHPTKPHLISAPFHHHASWLTLPELHEAQRRYTAITGEVEPQLAAWIAAMQVLEDHDIGVCRLVFWFDS